MEIQNFNVIWENDRTFGNFRRAEEFRKKHEIHKKKSAFEKFGGERKFGILNFHANQEKRDMLKFKGYRGYPEKHEIPDRTGHSGVHGNFKLS